MTDHGFLEREVRALYAISSALASNQSQQEVLDTMLERTVTELGYKAATLRLLDEEQQMLELQAAYGLSPAYVQKGQVAVAASGVDQTVLGGTPVMVSDVTHDSAFQYPAAAASEGLASVLVVPLTLRSRAIGVLRVYTGTPHRFSAGEQAFLVAVANLGAQALHRSQLYDAFQTIARHLNSSLELDEVLSTLVVESVDLLRVKAGSLRLLGPNHATLHLAAAYRLSEAYVRKGPVQLARSAVDARVLETLQPLALTEISRDAGLQYPEEAQREGIRSVLVVPLHVRGTAIGVLRIYSGRVRRFSAEEQAFASTVADLGALAIEHAKLYAALRSRLETLKQDADGWYRFLTLS